MQARDLLLLGGLIDASDAYLEYVKGISKFSDNQPQWDVQRIQTLRERVLATFIPAAALD